MFGAGTQCDPPSPRMLGSQLHCLTQPLSVPTFHPTPIEPGALPLLSGRKSRVAGQEPSAPGNYASCKHGLGHWPLSKQAEASPASHTPNSEQSLPQTAVQHHTGRGKRSGLALQASSLATLVFTPPWPGPRQGCQLQRAPLPLPFSFVCELLVSPVLPCLVAAVTRPMKEGGSLRPAC